MAKTKKLPSHPPVPKSVAETKPAAAQQGTGQPFRETIESFAIAIVLAFLIRTFAAEAFVIPTGSMANTLMGQHQDVYCVQCGQRYQVGASDQQDDQILRDRRHKDRSPVTQSERDAYATVAGTCSSCRDTMLYTTDLPNRFLESGLDVENLGHPFNGDRILVNKFIYDFQAPERWDVIVFRYPGRSYENYIKRLVGLPNERIRLYHGDVFIGANDVPPDAPYLIERKPPTTVLAVSELVHDTDHDAAELYNAGWPLRWLSNGNEWKTSAKVEEKRVAQKFAVEQPTQDVAWLQYQHTPPGLYDWLAAREDRPAGEKAFVPGGERFPKPQLVNDFNAYNSNIQRRSLSTIERLAENVSANGLHWVGDLILEADINVTSDTGELLLDLVKGGRHFVCRIDVATGKATLGIEEFETRAPVVGFSPQAETEVRGKGEHSLRFAHVDEQLLLWVDGQLVEFTESTAYDFEKLFGNRRDDIPRKSESDLGDLAPAAIGARGATLTADRMSLSRDIYYIATSHEKHRQGDPLTDYPLGSNYFQIRLDSKYWDLFSDRQEAFFPLGDQQFFVMGDNSPFSQDARLWTPDGPGGPYLDANLLIGRAVFVYWPHSWIGIPGTPIPLWPNFRDMRLVR